MSGLESRLRADGGLKWGYFEDDVLPAWVAEMDFGLAPPVSDALHDAIDRGLTGYPYPAAEEEVAVAATEFWGEQFGWRPEPEWVFPAPDVIDGLIRAVRHLTRPGSPVVLHTPVYFPFFSMVERAGREVVEVPSSRDASGRYSLDLARIDAALAAGAGSVVLCNPWNPTGRVMDREEIEDLLTVVRSHGARLLADEIHSPIVYDGRRHVPAASIDPSLVVTVASASKAWNLPGLKCAQVILGDEADRQIWSDYFTPEKVGVGTLGLIANHAAYTSGGPWLADVMARLSANRDLLTEMVADLMPDAVMAPVEGTYLAWLDMGAYRLEEPGRFLLEEARVAVTDGAPFGGDGRDFVRFNFATHEDILIEMVERMGGAVARL